MFLVNELIALLAANLILSQALGISTLFIASDNRKNLVGTAAVITVFTTFGSIAAYFINNHLTEKNSDFALLFYTIAVGILYVLLLTAAYFVLREKFTSYRKYIHISAFNCAVTGTIFTVNEKNLLAADSFTLSDYVLGGLGAGVGFIIAALILTAAYRNLNSKKVPASFRGFPAMLIYLGIISMAVYSLK